MGVLIVMLALTWWIDRNLHAARAGLVASSGSMSAATTYSGALGAVIVGFIAYLVLLGAIGARWVREHR